MYRENHEHKKRDYTIFFDSGGLGDLIASLPVFQYMINNFPGINLVLWVPHFTFNYVKASLTGKYSLRDFNSYDVNNAKPVEGISFHSFNRHMLGYHLTDLAAMAFINTQLAPEHKNYLPVNTSKVDLNKFNLPEKYVVMTTAYTTEVREFLGEKINEINKYIKSKGYSVVFLGKKHTDVHGSNKIIGNTNEEIDYSVGLDLFDKTTLVESAAIMKKASAVVGLDNGLLHLAATTDVPIVAGFTTVLPEHREPYRHNIKGWNWVSIVPPTSLKCSGCQSKWNLDFGTDFRFCHYVEKKQDTEIQCVKQLPVEKFIEALEKIL